MTGLFSFYLFLAYSSIFSLFLSLIFGSIGFLFTHSFIKFIYNKTRVIWLLSFIYIYNSHHYYYYLNYYNFSYNIFLHF
jgi:hypothetical protein